VESHKDNSNSTKYNLSKACPLALDTYGNTSEFNERSISVRGKEKNFNKRTRDKDICVSKAEKTDGISLKLFSWNVRSLCTPSKALQVEKAGSDIVLLQEVWKPKPEILSLIRGIRIKNLREDGYGGTIVSSKLPTLIQCSTPIKLNDDTVITKFALASNRIVWLSSVYINKGTRKNVLDTMAEIQKNIPETDWPYIILAGDWNVNLKDGNSKPTQALNMVCKNMNLNIVSCGNSRNEREIDFIVCGSKIIISDTKLLSCEEQSDHYALWAEIKVKSPEISLRIAKMPNRKVSNDLTIKSLKDCTDAKSFLMTLKRNFKKNKYRLMRKVRKKPQHNELLKRILSLDDEDDDDDCLLTIVKEFWKEKAIDCENARNQQTERSFFISKECI